MWARSAAAGLGGAATTVTLMLSLMWLPGPSLAVLSLILLLAAFPLWVALGYFCYWAPNLRTAWLGLAALALPSLLLNAWLYVR
ncbi:hypothetical protein ABIE09_000839 [Lysobacter enzymogenes]|jgi:hypothetical protein|uniref:DUF3649 domain-containing protein n=1 Tax=Lysobacter enzymogenes TaxID=69 RepID=A0AAU9AIT4_LYSEN|nr:hypothetical protein [Lysobacter enzymogenes]BAV98042.1 hypothetical protein LEN_2555 [Lysobacter enzymogenes]SDX39903.1 hypothetical protein SAMN05421681_105115 [Lysobacter enzymogenes]